MIITGAGLVLLDRKIYVERMTKLLSNDIKFSKPINEKIKTELTEKQLIDVHFKKKMKNEHIIERIKPTGSIIPRLYDLSKIHKPCLPLTNS